MVTETMLGEKKKQNKTVKPEPLSIKLLGELHDTSGVLSRKG